MDPGAKLSLRPKRLGRGRGLPFAQVARRKRAYSVNALIGMGLWTLLWLGYNTEPGYFSDSRFPTNPMVALHAIRSLFPMLAGWIAAIIIMARSKRALSWVNGPLGLMLVYSALGLLAAVTCQDNPTGGLYFGVNYLAIVLVLLAIASVDNPLPDIRHVLKLTWIVGTVFTLGLIGFIPSLGGGVQFQSAGTPERIYTGTGELMGMASSRNTGFARYAAMTAIIAIPGIWRESRRPLRIIWAAVFLASMYALVIANGRTEIAAFIVSVFVLFWAEKSKRLVFVLVGAAAAVLLALVGFYRGFFLYFTRTGHFDPSLTGRTETWDIGWRVFWSSPLMGLGFQADRVYLGTHMHNAFLHALLQSGLLGGGAMLLAIGMVGFYIIKYFFLDRPADKSLVPSEIPAIFLFVTISSITESTFAYFSAAWLLSAPIVVYVMALHRHMQRLSFETSRQRVLQLRMARRAFRAAADAGMASQGAAGVDV